MSEMEDWFVKAFGSRVKRYRIQNKFTQKHLADVCGFEVEYINRIEEGLENPSLKVINQLALELGLKDLNQLIGY